MLKAPLLKTFLGVLLGTFTAGVAAHAADKPNFVVIMADDLGYGDIGCFGNERIPTPNIDALAAGGMKFTDFHSNGAVCSPTRAALVTGRYQQRSGIGGVVTAKNHRETGLDPSEITFAEVLKDAGYATAMFGKWHLGYDAAFGPPVQGFDQFTGYVSGNVDFFSHIDQEGHEDWWHQEKLKPEEGYTTHLITQYGLKFIEEHKDQPFCLYLPHEAVHYPYQGPNDSAYRKAGIPGETTGMREDIAEAYKEMIVEMDKGIGETVALLKKLGLEENTLVLFFSDNGANTKGDNGVLKGFKGDPWEGGHRVPGVAYWPGKIKPGSETDVTALTMDVFPTLLDAAEVVVPQEVRLDGQSLMPILTGKSVSLGERTLFWGVGKGEAARRGDWKLVSYRAKGKGAKEPVVQLFNLSEDLAEEKDVSEAHPDIVKELKDALEDWKASWAEVEQRS